MRRFESEYLLEALGGAIGLRDLAAVEPAHLEQKPHALARVGGGGQLLLDRASRAGPVLVRRLDPAQRRKRLGVVAARGLERALVVRHGAVAVAKVLFQDAAHLELEIDAVG